MLFNSLEFAVFLPLVFALYWLIGGKQIRAQNILILVASYIFYGWWSPEFLLLIFFSSAVDFSLGVLMARSDANWKRKLLLAISLVVNLGLLVYFKYANFFLDNFVEAFRFFGEELSVQSLSIVLPVGISFYTFQTLSYTIDVYRRRIEPTRDLLSFFSYVSFFPQLVAGPIERAASLLPQFQAQRSFSFSKGRSGLRQILWGLFKKVVVADSCAKLANEIFNNYQDQSSGTLILGALYFSFQIYGDFSGYSDIAIGTARLFGFNLMTNFRYPYFSRDIAEFWRRWHISLSTWFRDYVYIPLGGSKLGKWMSLRNIFAIFIISGFWHGANWTYISWGFLNALYFLPLYLSNSNRKRVGAEYAQSFVGRIYEIALILTTFAFTMLAWVFFRAPSITDAFQYLAGITEWQFETPSTHLLKYLPLIAILVAWEWIMKNKPHGLAFTSIKRPLRWLSYGSLIWAIFYFYGEKQEFIYFQF